MQNARLDESQETGKFVEMAIPDHLTCLLRNLYAGQEELDMEQQTGSKLGKEYTKAVYCHPAYFTFICRVHHEKHWAG